MEQIEIIRVREMGMDEKLYAVFIDEGSGEKLIWESLGGRAKSGRRFFYGGSSITALIFTEPNSAHAFVKREKVLDDFSSDAQYYVRPITLNHA